MSIKYKIEISNEKIEDFSVFVEEIFKAVLECGKLIVKEQLENLDEKLMQIVTVNDIETKAAAKPLLKLNSER